MMKSCHKNVHQKGNLNLTILTFKLKYGILSSDSIKIYITQKENNDGIQETRSHQSCSCEFGKMWRWPLRQTLQRKQSLNNSHTVKWRVQSNDAVPSFSFRTYMIAFLELRSQ